MINPVVYVGLEKSKLEYLSEVVCNEFRITKSDLRSNSRKRKMVDARKVFCLITATKYSREEIGKFLNKNHSTISIAIKEAHNHLRFDK